MSQLTFKFPFKKKYFEQDFYVSKNNFSAYKLIESWPAWPGKWLNIFGTSGSGKTHLSKILEKKINKIIIVDEKDVNGKLIQTLNNFDCLNYVIPSKSFELGLFKKPIIAGVKGYTAAFLKNEIPNVHIFKPCDGKNAVKILKLSFTHHQARYTGIQNYFL